MQDWTLAFTLTGPDTFSLDVNYALGSPSSETFSERFKALWNRNRSLPRVQFWSRDWRYERLFQ
jgi:hypothetical protein